MSRSAVIDACLCAWVPARLCLRRVLREKSERLTNYVSNAISNLSKNKKPNTVLLHFFPFLHSHSISFFRQCTSQSHSNDEKTYSLNLFCSWNWLYSDIVSTYKVKMCYLLVDLLAQDLGCIETKKKGIENSRGMFSSTKKLKNSGIAPWSKWNSW